MNEDTISKTFAEFKREEFADWLWRGLRSFYTSPPSDRVRAFDDMGLLIIKQESVCEGIARIYEQYVAERRKLMFRQAIGDVLREHANDQKAPIPAFQDLIYLLGRIKATESLSALLSIVCSGFLKRRYTDVLYETFAVLRSLAPSIYAYDTAFALVNCLNFDDGYLFEAIKVLVECQPSQASKIILMLEPRLTQMRQFTQDIGGDEWNAFREAANDCAKQLLELAPISWIKELWEEANHMPEGAWLFELLFCNGVTPVVNLQDEPFDEYFMEYASKRVRLKVSRKDEWTRRLFRRIAAYEEVRKWAHDPNDDVNRIEIRNITEAYMPDRHHVPGSFGEIIMHQLDDWRIDDQQCRAFGALGLQA